MDKIGGAGMTALIIIGVIVLGVMAWGILQTQTTTKEAIEEEAGDCELAPTVIRVTTDAINPGTSISETSMFGVVNGKYRTWTTSTSFDKGDKLTAVLNGSGYISKSSDEITLDCGINTIEGELTKLDGSPTVKVFNDAGNVLTDAAAGGAINQSSSANPIALDMTVTVPSDEGVDCMVFVVEASNTSEIDEMTLSSGECTVTKTSYDRPDLHAIEGAHSTSIFRSYRVCDLADDGAKTRLGLLLEPESGVTMGTGNQEIYITWYVEQDYVDVDGTIQTGVENSDGTAQHVSAASSDYDFSVGNV